MLVPGARRVFRVKRALNGVRAGVAESFVEAADAVVRGGNKHQIAGRPGIEAAVREDAGHPVFGHFIDVMPAYELPFIG